MFPDFSITLPTASTQAPHKQLFQTLLNLACPGAAQYQAHRLRSDGVYRVVVRTATGFPIISIPAPALLLTQLGILVESDRYAITQQLIAAANDLESFQPMTTSN